jgi:hypothetical protein
MTGTNEQQFFIPKDNCGLFDFSTQTPHHSHLHGAYYPAVGLYNGLDALGNVVNNLPNFEDDVEQLLDMDPGDAVFSHIDRSRGQGAGRIQQMPPAPPPLHPHRSHTRAGEPQDYHQYYTPPYSPPKATGSTPSAQHRMPPHRALPLAGPSHHQSPGISQTAAHTHETDDTQYDAEALRRGDFPPPPSRPSHPPPPRPQPAAPTKTAKTSAGRATGAVAYCQEDCDLLLKLFKELEPMGPDEWERLRLKYNKTAKIQRGTWNALKTKFKSVSTCLHISSQ